MLRSPKSLLNPPVNGIIQGLFKAFECFSSTFQDKFNFQGLFKTVLYIQVLFKPVRTLDATANTVVTAILVLLILNTEELKLWPTCKPILTCGVL